MTYVKTAVKYKFSCQSCYANTSRKEEDYSSSALSFYVCGVSAYESLHIHSTGFQGQFGSINLQKSVRVTLKVGVNFTCIRRIGLKGRK